MTADELLAQLPAIIGGALGPLNTAANVARTRIVQLEHIVDLQKQKRAIEVQLDAALAAFVPGPATA